VCVLGGVVLLVFDDEVCTVISFVCSVFPAGATMIDLMIGPSSFLVSRSIFCFRSGVFIGVSSLLCLLLCVACCISCLPRCLSCGVVCVVRVFGLVV